MGCYGRLVEPPRRGTNGSAIASLVLGIVGVVGFPLTAPIALYFGYKGRREIDASAGAEEGRGLAIAGIVLGWVGTAFLILFAFIFLLFIIFAVGVGFSELD